MGLLLNTSGWLILNKRKTGLLSFWLRAFKDSRKCANFVSNCITKKSNENWKTSSMSSLQKENTRLKWVFVDNLVAIIKAEKILLCGTHKWNILEVLTIQLLGIIHPSSFCTVMLNSFPHTYNLIRSSEVVSWGQRLTFHPSAWLYSH